MKKLTLICFASLLVVSVQAQTLVGAWESIDSDDAGRSIRTVVVFADKFQTATWYDAQTGAFISTNGGSWSIEGNRVTEIVEFDTETPDRVGTSVSFEIELSDNELRIKGRDKVWSRIDSGEPGELAGAWLISGRMRDGEIRERSTDRPRKTMKILSGIRFQWIAYNTETKEFLGTGGGTYTTVDGKYTENIEFFSRDDSRVGAVLEFTYEIKDGKWHHSGKSSKGSPIYEIWSSREK